jgi:hypothetical protein
MQYQPHQPQSCLILTSNTHFCQLTASPTSQCAWFKPSIQGCRQTCPINLLTTRTPDSDLVKLLTGMRPHQTGTMAAVLHPCIAEVVCIRRLELAGYMLILTRQDDKPTERLHTSKQTQESPTHPSPHVETLFLSLRCKYSPCTGLAIRNTQDIFAQVGVVAGAAAEIHNIMLSGHQSLLCMAVINTTLTRAGLCAASRIADSNSVLKA